MIHINMNPKDEEREKMRDFIQKRRNAYEGNNISFEKSQDSYNIIAETYDKVLMEANSTLCYNVIAEATANVCPTNTRQHIEILDIGAGTGLVAQALRDVGFVHIDALDPNKQMLNKARQQNRYRNYYMEPISSTRPSSIKTGSYDIVTACAVFAKSGHMPVDGIPEMARFVKSGGHVVIVNRLQTDDTMATIEAVMNSLEVEGKWKLLSRDVWPGYLDITDDYGITWIFHIL